MAFQVRDAGTWKTPVSFSVRQDGGWVPVQTGYVRDAGTWKPFYVSTEAQKQTDVPDK